jgi:uncharacterized phage protein gp47/JayE
MVTIRNVNDIILGLIDYFKLVQPDLDTKPGTVSRDLFIDAPASQLALIYEELANVSNLQSIKLAAGADLDKLAKNYGITRKKAVPSSGTALLTFNSVDAPFAVNTGDLVITNSGVSFQVTTGVSINPASANSYRATASRFKNDLDFVGITDEYAIQVLVQCVSAGSIGNIGKYYLSRSTSTGISNVTNTNNFTGGSDQESDATFRNRILALFNGSSIGTALGYKSTALSTTNVVDATVIEPGDSLMTRDGTVVSVDSAGNRTIVSEGQGGKVDVIILGQNLLQTIDTYIYQDKSNTNNAANEKNDIVLGQISGDENKTINRRRIDDIQAGTLPSQPVDSILSVQGSLSGPNFIPKSVDYLGRVSGNYELVKDTGVYAGSPWGFDKFRWVSNKISGFSQDLIKGKSNGQDPVSYTDVLNIPNIVQNISISNENSIVTNDRSIIQLLHYPAINVTRVFNVNTGERYFVVNQNVDNTGSTNTTGRIKISGNTLPSVTDVLQVDYTWVFDYDQYSDYDGKYLNNNIRPSLDSIDWGYCSKIKNETVLFSKDAVANIFSGSVSHPISSVVSCNVFQKVDGIVSEVTSGIYVGRKQVTVTNLLSPITSIENIYLKNTYTELYSTAENNGSYINATGVVGIKVVFNVTVILPTDTIAKIGEVASVIFNSSNVYYVNNLNGSFSSNVISIPADNISTISSQLYLNVSYVANVSSLYSSGTSLLPASRSANGYLQNNLGFVNVNLANNLKRDSKLIQKNASNNYYIELDITVSDYTLTESDIVSIVRASDGAVIWDSMHQGSVTFNSLNNKYQIILSGYNSPVENNQVVVFYYAKDNTKFQPISFSNDIISIQQGTVQFGANQQLYVDAFNFIDNPGPLKFEIIDPTSQIVYAEVLDGYLQVNPLQPKQITAASLTADFNNIIGIKNYKVKVYDGYNLNNNGIFDIVDYDSAIPGSVLLNIDIDLISKSQISIIRLSDNKEIWNETCSIDLNNNQLVLSNFGNPKNFDKVLVLYYNYKNLRNSPTKISSSIFDQNVSSGSITVSGSSVTKIENVIFTCVSNGLEINFLEAVTKGLGLSTANISSNIKLARLVKLEKVITAGNLDEVTSVIVNYDVLNSQIKNNGYYCNELVENLSLDRFSAILPASTKNTLNNSTTPYLPKVGDKLRATIYVVNSSDSESLSYTAPGTLYTNKKFCLIDRVYVNSGFKSSGSSTLSLNTINQPLFGSRYKTFYDYTAPKTNERITITYDYNQTITEATFNIEKNRPINADVIVKQANAILVDVTMNIVVTSTLTNSSNIVSQNTKDALISSINLNSLGGIIDASDLVNSAYSIDGVDRARIIYFNKNGSVGSVLSLVAQKNEYFVANNVIINIENR